MSETYPAGTKLVAIEGVLQLIGGMCPECQARCRALLGRLKPTMLQDIFTPVDTDLSLIAQKVSKQRNLAVSVILSKTHAPRIVDARRQIAVEARAMGYSLKDIGQFIGRHHTTVLHLILTAKGNGHA